MDINKTIQFWIKSSEEDLKTAKSLFKSKRYSHCLFFCHLFIEKILKALASKNIGKPAPYGHNLLRFVELSDLDLLQAQKDLLDEINTFNIEARYNDYKFQFYKKAIKDYAQRYLRESGKFYLWLKKQL